MLTEARQLHQEGRLAEAAALYREVLHREPGNAVALHLLGIAEAQSGQLLAALELIDRALAIDARNAVAFYNRGKVLRQLERMDEALASFDRAIAIRPDYAEAHSYRGSVLRDLRRFDDALASFDRALAIKPNSPEAHNDRGNLLRDFKRFDDALVAYDRALAVRPNAAEPLNNRGSLLREMRRFDDAITTYDRLLTLQPDHPLALGDWLFSRMQCCDWRGLAPHFDRLAGRIERGEKASAPFPVLATPLGIAQQRKCAEIYVRQTYGGVTRLPALGERPARDRIRLGYFSGDFHNHPVAHLFAELPERHDRSRFEVIGLSSGVANGDAMTARLKRSFDRFIDSGALPDRDIALLARQLDIDIAVDLGGFTTDSRMGVFAMRAAPIQVSYLGYPGTIGADFMDYLLADPIVIPEEDRRHYAEKIVYLPDSYQCNDATRRIADVSLSRRECGLPEQGFVFCCFNNTYKLTAGIFDIWMRLLNRIPESVLWLSQGNETARRNLKREADARGVNPARLVFADFLADMDDHLARLKRADLFLDTLPFNAHATASDALWAGLPILTCEGKTFPGRVGASLLSAVGLNELIARDPSEYEALAVELATNPQKLSAVRQKLATNRKTWPLFDTGRFVRNVEQAFLSMWERYQARLPPDHIHVQR